MSIIRTIHNKENPYVQIHSNTLQDYSLSLEATGLLCRFLSNRADFVFHIKVICKQMKLGKDKLYRLLNELIDNGYGFRYQHREDKTKRFSNIEYIILEEKSSPEQIEVYREELKKSLPCLENQCTATQYTGNGNVTNNKATKQIIKPQQQGAAAVVAPKEGGGGSFAYQKETLDAMKALGLTDEQVKRITKKWEEDKALRALKFCEKVKPTKDVMSQFVWSCNNHPEIPLDKNEMSQHAIKNKQMAEKLLSDDKIYYEVFAKELYVYVHGIGHIMGFSDYIEFEQTEESFIYRVEYMKKQCEINYREHLKRINGVFKPNKD